MRAALHGTLDDWVPWDDSGLRWHRPDHPEDGVITLTEGGLSLKELFERRAAPEPEPRPDPIRAELDALRREVDELKTLVSRGTLIPSTQR